MPRSLANRKTKSGALYYATLYISKALPAGARHLVKMENVTAQSTALISKALRGLADNLDKWELQELDS